MAETPVVEIYNNHMNGVDVSDQYRSYYKSGGSYHKWWKYLFWFFVDLCVVNGFILRRLRGRTQVSQREH